MMRFLTVAALVAHFFSASVAEPGEDSSWTTFTTADGLTVDAIGALALAPNGDLWCAYLAPGAGLSCFNGETWISHTKETGLPEGTILWTGPLATAPDGTVWVGMFDRGLCRYDGKTWSTYTVADGLLNDKVSTVAVSQDGVVWCGHGVEDGGLTRFDGESWTTYGPDDTGGVGEFPILSAATGPDGRLWVGSSDLTCHDGKNWTRYSLGGGMQPPALSLAVASDGTVWVGGAGVSSFDGQEWRHYSFADMGAEVTGNHGVPAIASAQDGMLWVGAGDLGLFCFDGTTWTRFTSADGLVHDSVMAVAVAPDGSVWCGTERGLSRYVP